MRRIITIFAITALTAMTTSCGEGDKETNNDPMVGNWSVESISSAGQVITIDEIIENQLEVEEELGLILGFNEDKTFSVSVSYLETTPATTISASVGVWSVDGDKLFIAPNAGALEKLEELSGTEIDPEIMEYYDFFMENGLTISGVTGNKLDLQFTITEDMMGEDMPIGMEEMIVVVSFSK